MQSLDLYKNLTKEHLELLGRYRFDAPAFTALQNELSAGNFPMRRNEVKDALSPLLPHDVVKLPTADHPHFAEWTQAGHEAIAKGQVAVAILNGGMATRFGGVVKGVVPVVDGHTFLSLKLRDVTRQPGRVPVFLLNSFATVADTLAHLESKSHFGLPKAQITSIEQSISMRLIESGALYAAQQGGPSFFAPGHGDLLSALKLSAAYDAFVAGGGRFVVVSNVDNLAATVSPLVVGAHIAAKKMMTVEVAPKLAGDAGGAPVRRHDRVEVLEGFRFPPTFDQSQLKVFNTNTFVLSVEAIAGHYPLTWFRADKKVEGVPVVQFERLLGELTTFVPATYLEVPRSGATGRFLPVKAPGDLPGIVPWVQANLLGGR